MKTIKNIITLSLVTATAILTIPSCQKTGTDVEYLQTSIDRYTFMGTGDQTLQIGIQSTASWTTECDEDWIILEQTADTLTVSVKENKSGFQKSGNILVKSGNLTEKIAIEQLSDRFKGRFEDMYYFSHYIAMSRNGRYIAGMKTKEIRNDAYIYTPTIIDTYTGEETYLEDIQGFDAINAISDDGKTLIYMQGGSTVKCLRDGVEFELTLPEGYNYPNVSSISSDGSVMVGYCINSKSSGWKPYVAVKWINGEPEILDIPSHNIWGIEDNLLSVMARGCSNDGSIAFGSEWTDFGLIYWKGKELHYPGYDYADKTEFTSVILEAETTNISPNGKYIGTSKAQYVEMSFPIKQPAVINTETGQLILIENSEEGSCKCVTDDGIAFIASPSALCDHGLVANINDGTVQSLTEWFQNNYNIGLSDNRYVMQVSDDGKVIWGIQAIPAPPMGLAFIPWYCYIGE